VTLDTPRGASYVHPVRAAGRAWLIGWAVAMVLVLPGNAAVSPTRPGGPAAGAATPTTAGPAAATATTTATTTTAPPPSGPTSAGVTAAPDRWPGHTFVAGDSLTATSLSSMDPGPDAPDDLVVSAGIGWTARHVQPHLDLAQIDRPVDTLVVALATNDSAPFDGGWTADDEAAFRRLVGSVGDAACVVVVLPGHAPTADLARVAEMAEARLALWSLVDERRQGDWYGPTVVVDWQERVDARPDLMSPDGIHLTPRPGVAFATAEAAAWRTSLYWEGTARCGTEAAA
jgi:hypothetical protein